MERGTMPHVFNELGQLVGRVEADGSVCTVSGQVVGGVSGAGLIYDGQGDQVGEVHRDGGIYAWPRTYVGYVGSGIPLVPMGGAGLLLLLLAQPLNPRLRALGPHRVVEVGSGDSR